MKKLEWQYPTSWSVETTDGKFYLEFQKNGTVNIWENNKLIGNKENMKKAKIFAQKVAKSNKPDHIGDVTEMVDPRDAVIQKLKEGLEKLSRLGNEPELGNSIGNVIAQETLAEVKQMEGNND